MAKPHDTQDHLTAAGSWTQWCSTCERWHQTSELPAWMVEHNRSLVSRPTLSVLVTVQPVPMNIQAERRNGR